jgi:hypothetical protein
VALIHFLYLKGRLIPQPDVLCALCVGVDSVTALVLNETLSAFSNREWSAGQPADRTRDNRGRSFVQNLDRRIDCLAWIELKPSHYLNSTPIKPLLTVLALGVYFAFW